MFEPDPRFQLCAGISMVLLSFGGTWSMITGAVVQFRVAGANFSVNQKLDRVQEATSILEDVTDELSQEPKVNRQKIARAEEQLQLAMPKIEETETQVQHDLDELGNLGD